jgi:hypothetical protein
MSLRLVFATAWLLPIAAAAALLYYEFMIPGSPLEETNRGMRQRMCREHVVLVQTEPANGLARDAVEECMVSGYLTQAEGLTAID